ncbi:MAG: metalloregulator ArsR/SmtB family transcription factor [Nitrospirae bacterium]|nr:metalloregulator ArsR/SmtB family transcription factor [Nitrospirota bacterium]
MRSRSRTFKNRIYAQFARVGKALSSPKRLELLELLAQGERTVEGLSREASQTIANCSRHLQVLRQANLVETRKEGTYVYYRLADDGVSRFWLELRALAEERLAEVERVVRDYIELKDDFEPIGCSELLDRLRKGEVVVLDVRPEEEYRAGHLPGALSVPPGEVERRLASLPRDREIVAYCRGRYCVYAVEAVKALRKHGYAARRMEQGIPEWRLLGFPLEVGGTAG